MKCSIDYYHTPQGDKPVGRFIDDLDSKIRAKVFRTIGLLSDFGTFLPLPHVEKLHGEKGLWELRTKFSSNVVRILFFYPSGDRALLLHGIVKKSNNTPKRDLRIARQRKVDSIKRRL